MPNPKRRVDDGSVLLGDSVVPVTNALAAVLGKVAAEVGRQLGGARPDEVRLTHPAQWGAARRNILLSVPLFYAGLRLAGKRPNPLPFFCYGYAIILAALALLGVVGVIVRPAVTDASDLVLPGILGGVAVVLALVPLVVRAVREGGRPPAVR